MIDNQSVKAPSAENRGFDAGKKIVGRKRHIAVDTGGRLLMVNLTTADISDSAGAQAILDGIRRALALGQASLRQWRRLVREYEKRIDVSQTMILVAMGGNLLRRNAHP